MSQKAISSAQVFLSIPGSFHVVTVLSSCPGVDYPVQLKRRKRRIRKGRRTLEKLTLENAKEINAAMVTEPGLLLHAANVSAAMGAMAEHFGEDCEHWLLLHAANVSAAMGAMAEHFGEDREHWEAVGWLHDYDYEKYPEEHLAHTEEPLRALGVPEEDIRAILSHGYGICTDVEPVTNMEKSLFTVDELTGIVQAACKELHEEVEGQAVRGQVRPSADP